MASADKDEDGDDEKEDDANVDGIDIGIDIVLVKPVTKLVLVDSKSTAAAVADILKSIILQCLSSMVVVVSAHAAILLFRNDPRE